MRVEIERRNIVRRRFLDLRPFAGRDFGLELRDDFSRYLAFDCEYICDIAIVPVRPKVVVRPRID